jgi:hypothetical protein
MAAITKKDLIINGSNYYKENFFVEQAKQYPVVFEDIADPERIATKNGYTSAQWPLIMRFNRILDPIEELVPGIYLLMPTPGDLNALK